MEGSMKKAEHNPEGPKFKGVWKGTDPNPPKPGMGVGGMEESDESILKDLSKGPRAKTKEEELAEAFAQFNEDDLGVEEKRPSRKGARPDREYTKHGKPSKRYTSVKEFAENPRGDDEGGKVSLIVQIVDNLLKAGNTVDSYVLGARGHVERADLTTDGFTPNGSLQIRKIGTKPSKQGARGIRPFKASDDANYDIQMVGPKHYKIVDKMEGRSDEVDEMIDPELIKSAGIGLATGLAVPAVSRLGYKAAEKVDNWLEKRKSKKKVKQTNEGWGADAANARHAEQQSDWDKTLEKHKDDPKMTSRLKHLRAWKASEAEKAAHAGEYVVRGRGYKFPGEDLEEARSDQVHTVNIVKRSSFGGESRTRTTSGTIPELLKYFGYTLEVGKAYEHERGRYKINMQPKNVKSLVDNLNKAASNGASNGAANTYYTVGEEHQITESIESADPVEGAVLKAAQELIHQGHTDVAPEVITNMVVAATGKPFMLKDLVDANKKSPAIQHYIDSINPSKVKFSSDILTVKNENPAKAKAKSASTVSSMAAKAASRPRLGEAKKKSEVDESRGHKIVASKLKDIERWNKPIDDDAPKNWVVYNKTEDKPYMAFSSKQEAYNFLMDKMFFDKDYTVVHKSEIGEPTTEDIQPMANPQANPGSVAPANTPQTLTPNDEQSEQDPKTAAQTATALSTLKSAAGIQAQPQDIAKALDDASQGKQVAQTDMTKIKPMMDILKTAGTDPKVAQQFKTIATQAKTSQQQQLMKSKLAQQQKT